MDFRHSITFQFPNSLDFCNFYEMYEIRTQSSVFRHIKVSEIQTNKNLDFRSLDIRHLLFLFNLYFELCSSLDHLIYIQWNAKTEMSEIETTYADYRTEESVDFGHKFGLLNWTRLCSVYIYRNPSRILMHNLMFENQHRLIV